MADVRLITGTPRTGRAELVDDLLLEHWGEGCLIVPTRRAARMRLAGLLDHGNLSGALGRPG